MGEIFAESICNSYVIVFRQIKRDGCLKWHHGIAAFTFLPLPKRPQLGCRVSGLVLARTVHRRYWSSVITLLKIKMRKKKEKKKEKRIVVKKKIVVFMLTLRFLSSRVGN